MSEETVTSKGCLPSGCLFPLGVMLVAGGIALAWFSGWSTFRETWRVRAWPETSCTVTRAEVKVSVENGALLVEYDISYRYTWQGAERSGTRLRAIPPGTGDSDVNAMEATCAALRAAPEQRCRVNPLDPADSVLEKPGYGHTLRVLIVSVIVVLFGMIMAQSTLGMRRIFGWLLGPVFRPLSGRLLTPAFSLLSGAAGIAIYWFGIHDEPDWSAVESRMQAVPCTIVKSEVGGTRRKRELRVLFRYEFAGRTWHSCWPDFDQGRKKYRTRKLAKDLAARYPAGHPSTCHVDPKQPWMAVIEKRGGGRFWRWTMAILFSAIGFVVFQRWLLRGGFAAAARRA